MTHLSAQQAREIAARSYLDPQTVRNVYKGRPVKHVSWLRAAKAAEELGHPLPPPHLADASVPPNEAA